MCLIVICLIGCCFRVVLMWFDDFGAGVFVTLLLFALVIILVVLVNTLLVLCACCFVIWLCAFGFDCWYNCFTWFGCLGYVVVLCCLGN